MELTINYKGIEFQIEATWIPPQRGVMYTRNGDGWPDEPGYWDWESITVGEDGEDAEKLFKREVIEGVIRQLEDEPAPNSGYMEREEE